MPLVLCAILISANKHKGNTADFMEQDETDDFSWLGKITYKNGSMGAPSSESWKY